MDQLLQKVSGANMLFMLDGFSGYNKILENSEDKDKTTFATPWGTFMYSKVPFGLSNARATFHRAMDLEFVWKVNNFFVIYLDDLTFYF